MGIDTKESAILLLRSRFLQYLRAPTKTLLKGPKTKVFKEIDWATAGELAEPQTHHTPIILGVMEKKMKTIGI